QSAGRAARDLGDRAPALHSACQDTCQCGRTDLLRQPRIARIPAMWRGEAVFRPDRRRVCRGADGIVSGERRDFIVELGTEELPPLALRGLEHAFAEGMRSG